MSVKRFLPFVCYYLSNTMLTEPVSFPGSEGHKCYDVLQDIEVALDNDMLGALEIKIAYQLDTKFSKGLNDIK